MCCSEVVKFLSRGELISSMFQVVVCSNHLTFQDEVNQVVIHELIHAYDDCRAANLNWTNCAHHACSEVYAAICLSEDLHIHCFQLLYASKRLMLV